MPLISVVIPCFRSGVFLKDAIESVLAQTETDWELVLVDNNASPETRAITDLYSQNYPSRIRIVHEPLQGVTFARNRGILESRGRYIALLDDDDMMYPDRLKLQRDAIEAHPETSIVYGLIDKVSLDNATVLEQDTRNTAPEWARKIFPGMSGLVFLLPSVMFFEKKPSLEKRLFDLHFSPCYMEDDDLSVRMFFEGPFACIPEPIIRFRVPSKEFLYEKRKNIVFWTRNLINQDYFFHKLRNLCMLHRDVCDPGGFRYLKSQWLREASFPFFSYEKGVALGRFLLQKSLRTRPLDLKSWKMLIRSYFPSRLRKRYFRSEIFSDDPLPEQMDRKFLDNLFGDFHDCPYCQKGQ